MTDAVYRTRALRRRRGGTDMTLTELIKKLELTARDLEPMWRDGKRTEYCYETADLRDLIEAAARELRRVSHA